jgi:hypothetical protein
MNETRHSDRNRPGAHSARTPSAGDQPRDSRLREAWWRAHSPRPFCPSMMNLPRLLNRQRRLRPRLSHPHSRHRRRSPPLAQRHGLECHPDAPGGYGNYNFILNAQGASRATPTSIAADGLLLDTDRSQAPRLLAHLDHFIIMDDVELSPLDEATTGIGFSGPQAAQSSTQLGLNASGAGAHAIRCCDPR